MFVESLESNAISEAELDMITRLWKYVLIAVQRPGPDWYHVVDEYS